MSERTVRVVLDWADPVECDAVGLQDKSGELVPGEPRPDGALRYEAEMKVKPGKGGLDFSGAHVHGTAGERFLYLSFRQPDGSGWARRSKIMLPRSAPDHGEVMRARVIDASTSRAKLDGAGWIVE